jgi:hypothetical protein
MLSDYMQQAVNAAYQRGEHFDAADAKEHKQTDGFGFVSSGWG